MNLIYFLISTLSVLALLHSVDCRFENMKENMGVCYSAMHNKQYPLLPGEQPTGLDWAIHIDFAQMSKYFRHIRTFYSNFYGFPIAKSAAAFGIKLHLGVYMTDESWYKSQVDSAIEAARDYPDTVEAILVGNENVQPYGKYSVDEIIRRVNEIKNRLRKIGRAHIPVGTVQRITEYVNHHHHMKRLSQACNVIGVNIYPFFDKHYSKDRPDHLLNALWDQMVQRYPIAKIRITETGFPTNGAPHPIAPNNIPSLANSRHYHKAVLRWTRTKGYKGPAFWFSFYDRRHDQYHKHELEKHFGFFTWDRKNKGILTN